MYSRGRSGLAGGLLLALALTLGAVGIGYVAYNAGIRDGAAQVAAGEAVPEAEQSSPG